MERKALIERLRHAAFDNGRENGPDPDEPPEITWDELHDLSYLMQCAADLLSAQGSGDQRSASRDVEALNDAMRAIDRGMDPAECRAMPCQCCECQGKHCLMPHPGHSHRHKEMAADLIERMHEAVRTDPMTRLHNFVDIMQACDRCGAAPNGPDDPVVLCAKCAAQPSLSMGSGTAVREALGLAYDRGWTARASFIGATERPPKIGDGYEALRAEQVALIPLAALVEQAPTTEPELCTCGHSRRTHAANAADGSKCWCYQGRCYCRDFTLAASPLATTEPKTCATCRRLLLALKELERLYNTDGVASGHAREIERLFDACLYDEQGQPITVEAEAQG
jgi:hypothetical protein